MQVLAGKTGHLLQFLTCADDDNHILRDPRGQKQPRLRRHEKLLVSIVWTGSPSPSLDRRREYTAGYQGIMQDTEGLGRHTAFDKNTPRGLNNQQVCLEQPTHLGSRKGLKKPRAAVSTS